MLLEQLGMADQHGEDGDLARRLARPAREAGLLRQRGAGDADARPRFGEAKRGGRRRAPRVRPARPPARAVRPKKGGESLRHVGGVVAPQRLVGDRAGELLQARLEAGALFRRVETRSSVSR